MARKKRPARNPEKGRPKKKKGEGQGKQKKEERSSREGAGSIRLNKYIAHAGICSRREADKLIESGAIRVNGEVVTELGVKVRPEDEVRYGKQRIDPEPYVYILLNKPKDHITTTSDEQGRKTVMRLVRDAGGQRLYPVGRLDRNTTGLLLLTNDGELAQKLTHPRQRVSKLYHVVLDRNLKPGDLEKLTEGVELDDGKVAADSVSYVEGANNKREVGMTLHSGKNRVIRRMFEALGYNVKNLDRVMFAGLTKKDLARGKWRYLSGKEVRTLKSKLSTKPR